MVFITVRFGDDRSALFNPNCRNVNLLQNIRTKCECSSDDELDLSDYSGEVASIANHPDDYGRDYLIERGNFILVRVEKEVEGDDERVTYIPMHYGMQNDKEFLDRLNPKQTKSGKSKKRGGRDDTASPNRRKCRNGTTQGIKKNPSRQGNKK